jgi:hypothetical protein
VQEQWVSILQVLLWVNSMIRGTMLKKYHYYLIVTETTKYALRVANPRAGNMPAGGWPPERHIVMIP